MLKICERAQGSAFLTSFQFMLLCLSTVHTWSKEELRKLAVVQSFSHIWLFATPWTAAFQANLSFTISWSLLKLVSIELVMPSNHLILCHPLLLLPSIFPIIRVFSSESALHIQWSKYWHLSFSISPSNEYSGFISVRINWFEFLAVLRTLKSQEDVYKGGEAWTGFWRGNRIWINKEVEREQCQEHKVKVSDWITIYVDKY